MWFPCLQEPRTGSRFAVEPLPAPFITTPNSFACQARQSAAVHPGSNRPHIARPFSPVIYFTTLQSVQPAFCADEIKISVGS